jgi:hypothetical protein
MPAGQGLAGSGWAVQRRGESGDTAAGVCRGPDLNRHGPCGPRDFKSRASTSSATPAFPLKIEEYRVKKCRQSSFCNLQCARRRTDSNRRIKVLQTSPLPLGYGAGIKKPRHLVGYGAAGPLERGSVCSRAYSAITGRSVPRRAERETGFEPATSTLARLRSTN